MAKVTIVQRILPHYRIRLFSRLVEELAKDGIELNLIYGQELMGTVPKTSNFNAPWAHRVSNSYFQVFGIEVVWQPCLRLLDGSDLIIVEQANRLLINYVLFMLRKIRGFKLAYWGHGKNMCNKPGQNKIREKIKHLLVDKVDWWFAYTNLTATVVSDFGVPKDRISVIMNSIDTLELEQGLSEATPERINALKRTIGIRSDHVGVFCAGMNREKCLDFLLQSCLKIREKVPDFEMLFIGSGPEQFKVEEAAIQYPWIHYVGPKYGTDRVSYLMLGKALLMPGLIGLVVIDSFVTQRPLITIDIPGHGPEIDYLETGRNGILLETSEASREEFARYLKKKNPSARAPFSEYSTEAYANCVVSYFKSDDMQSILRSGCAESAQRYSMENMVNNFADGVKQCLLKG